MEGATAAWRQMDGQRRLTRMEMHQAMKEEINELYNAALGHTSWEDTNLLARLNVSLEDLWDVYGTLARSGRTPSGSYGDTPLMRA